LHHHGSDGVMIKLGLSRRGYTTFRAATSTNDMDICVVATNWSSNDSRSETEKMIHRRIVSCKYKQKF
jgi:hypothetical protein